MSIFNIPLEKINKYLSNKTELKENNSLEEVTNENNSYSLSLNKKNEKTDFIKKENLFINASMDIEFIKTDDDDECIYIDGAKDELDTFFDITNKNGSLNIKQLKSNKKPKNKLIIKYKGDYKKINLKGASKINFASAAPSKLVLSGAVNVFIDELYSGFANIKVEGASELHINSLFEIIENDGTLILDAKGSAEVTVSNILFSDVSLNASGSSSIDIKSGANSISELTTTGASNIKIKTIKGLKTTVNSSGSSLIVFLSYDVVIASSSGSSNIKGFYTNNLVKNESGVSNISVKKKL